jgi:hypothetical protein
MKAIKYSLIAGCFILSLAIVLIAPLLVPADSRSNYFWLRVVWTEVLNFLFWGSALFYIIESNSQKNSGTSYGGIAPTLLLIISAYIILSFSAMVLYALLFVGDLSNRVHWIAQIVLFASTSFSIVFILISRSTGTAGDTFDKEKAIAPKELHDLLAAQESFFRSPESQSLRSGIKQLRELLTYSISESTSLAESPEYQELSFEIKNFCISLTNLQESDTEKLSCLKETITKLVRKTKLVSTQMIRR